jgi:hypothetical protein
MSVNNPNKITKNDICSTSNVNGNVNETFFDSYDGLNNDKEKEIGNVSSGNSGEKDYKSINKSINHMVFDKKGERKLLINLK